MLRGKGIYIWQVPASDNGDAQQIVTQAEAAGLGHVLVKVTDGTKSYPQSQHENATVAAINALRVAGIEVWGWGYVYGKSPRREADIAVQRIQSLNLSGFVIDAEGEYRDRPAGTAERYMKRLRATLPNLPLALSSFRFPSVQGDYPFDEFLAHCQIAMPQVYWVAQSGGDPAWDLERCFREYTDRWPSRAFIPTGAAYGEWQGDHEWWWTAHPHQITAFLDKAKALGLRAVNFFSWQNARFDQGNPNYPNTELWQAIANYPWLDGEAAPLPENRLVEAAVGLKYRSQPSTEDAHWVNSVVFPKGTPLNTLDYPTWPEEPGTYRWQRIRTMDGQEGWVGHTFGASVYLTYRKPSGPVVIETEKPAWVIEPLGLKFRRQPIPDDQYWIDQLVFLRGTELVAIGSPVLDGSGHYRWQKIRAPDGREGYVAYGYDDQVYLSDEKPAGPTDPVTTVWTISDLNVRDAPLGNIIWTVGNGTALAVLEDPVAAAKKVGMGGKWLNVRTPGPEAKEGFVAAWYVTADKPADTRQPMTQARLGESPFIYGIHDPFDPKVFANGRGWVLFTEAVGHNAQHAGGNQASYIKWVEDGFGVIARLNNGYNDAGTVPTPQFYSDFAAACAQWVRNSIDPNRPAHSCHIWIIGNEMNNPREWPGNIDGQGGQPITPEGYADCFNRAYAAIKAEQPDAIVCPGAVDPYFGPGSDNGQWFRQMLAHITQLDGFALHSYTHGTDPGLITSLQRFGQDANGNWVDPGNILRWQYYNFFAYRTYMDMIPPKWRRVPVFITETDQVEPWADKNSGWVQAAYAEIDRWNQQPNAQQIRALLLYRWPNLDQWGFQDKQGVHRDLRKAVKQGYRWRA